MHALAGIPRTSYEARLVRHFFHHYPRECNDAGLHSVQQLVRSGIDQAAAHGYRGQRAVATYINLMIVLGSGFDTDPQIPWAGEQLRNLTITDAAERIQRVFQSALAYLDATVGADNQHIARALIRIRKHDFHAPPPATGGDFAADILATFAGWYPQKTSFQGDTANRDLIASALKAARLYGLTGGKGQFIYAANAFMLGSGFDTDCLYPWAAEALTEQAVADQEAKANRLIDQSLAYLERSLRN